MNYICRYPISKSSQIMRFWWTWLGGTLYVEWEKYLSFFCLFVSSTWYRASEAPLDLLSFLCWWDGSAGKSGFRPGLVGKSAMCLQVRVLELWAATPACQEWERLQIKCSHQYVLGPQPTKPQELLSWWTRPCFGRVVYPGPSPARHPVFGNVKTKFDCWLYWIDQLFSYTDNSIQFWH